MLSDYGIVKHHVAGDLVIEPFVRENCGPNSYDVTLGEWYYRETPLEDPFAAAVLNPFSPASVRRTWGEKRRFLPLLDAVAPGTDLTNLREDMRVVLLDPGESLLCHTEEFVGTRRGFTASMQARSSYGRAFTTVCRDAGFGDVGYFNRWTMEVTNNARHHRLLLVAGMRVAQLVFEEVVPAVLLPYGHEARDSKYQEGDSLAAVMSAWRPEMMLPRLHLDREIVEDSR